MFKTYARITGFLITTMLVLAVPFVYADNGNSQVQDWGHGYWESQGDHHGEGFLQGLTEAQKKQLKDLWEKQRETKKAAFEQIKADKEALTNELLQTTPDVNKINEFKSKLEALGAQKLDNRINTDLEVKKILTAEQFARFVEFQKHKFARRFHRKEWGHHGEGWGHWRHCRHHQSCHRYHHGNWDHQQGSDYGDHGYNE